VLYFLVRRFLDLPLRPSKRWKSVAPPPAKPAGKSAPSAAPGPRRRRSHSPPDAGMLKAEKRAVYQGKFCRAPPREKVTLVIRPLIDGSPARNPTPRNLEEEEARR